MPENGMDPLFDACPTCRQLTSMTCSDPYHRRPVPANSPYLRRMHELGVLDEVDAIYDAAECGELLGEPVSIDDFLAEVVVRLDMTPWSLEPTTILPLEADDEPNDW
jgi:hypothetical protein